MERRKRNSVIHNTLTFLLREYRISITKVTEKSLDYVAVPALLSEREFAEHTVRV